MRRLIRIYGALSLCFLLLNCSDESTSPRTISGASSQQHNAQAAFGSSHHLIVWGDLRLSNQFDIYAARYR